MSMKQLHHVQRLRNIKPVLALTVWVKPANNEGMYQPAHTVTAYPRAFSSLVVLQAGSEKLSAHFFPTSTTRVGKHPWKEAHGHPSPVSVRGFADIEPGKGER